MESEQNIKLILSPEYPKYIGGYDITGGNGKENSIVMTFTRKPKWHNRLFCKLFLGWTWIDYK
jgi:hypothetical protein